MTQYLETEMREWLLDCFEEEEDQEEILELSYERLCKSVNKYFDGGLKAFFQTP
jgi:hypothetical protein